MFFILLTALPAAFDGRVADFVSSTNMNLCKKEIISENKYANKYEIYSCNNTFLIKEKIKNFPTLYFTIKSESLNFTFTYNDLFKLFDNKLYFLIIFPIKGPITFSNEWFIGEIFLKKYICTFNLETKSISFYKNQINKSNDIIEQKVNNGNANIWVRYLIEIFMGLIIIFFAYLIYRAYRKSRKLLANELEDSNYIYVSNEKIKENEKENKLISEKELN